MEEIKINNKHCCRLCDSDITATDQRHNIFDKNADGKQLINLIKECLPLVIYRTDPLSKQICETCYKKLCSLYDFKKTSINTANKYLKQFKNNEENASKDVKLFLACDTPNEDNRDNIPILGKDVTTSTDDLTVTCFNCKSSCFDSNMMNNEVELCAELHKAIADSLSNNNNNNNKVTTTDTDPEKVLRSRRRRSQAFYHELDDSLCSSLTEFTNTESSQFYEEYGSDMESYESDDGDGVEHKAKRRKIEHDDVDNTIINNNNNNNEDSVEKLKIIFENETEYRYNPLSLLQLTLNVINKNIISDYQPIDVFYQELIEPLCNYCNVKFKNTKLLALHQLEHHITIKIDDKVDDTTLWDDTRDYADVRNKWLNNYDNIVVNDDDDGVVDDDDDDDDDNSSSEYVDDIIEDQSLLIPIGSEDLQDNDVNDEQQPEIYEILFDKSKPVVNGIPLSEYTKEERKTFYKTVKIGGVNKKFCTLCRYSFKDNWAIESHYFSSACYYTCRYCGMRFNKQRHRFDEHVIEHEERGDDLSNQVYAACKNNNIIPRIIPIDKCDDIPPPLQCYHEKISTNRQLEYRNQYNVRIKEEPLDSPPLPSSSNTVRHNNKQNLTTSQKTNQAYFCRKCYKVFFKLDEFNIHSKNCDYNQFPAHNNNNSNNNRKSGNNTNGDVTNSGRSTKNHYNDDYNNKESPHSFICFICNTPFPTIYSRNSHMRIHKGETTGGGHSPSTSQNFYTPKLLDPTTDIRIKQEPLEPEIQIHESEQNYNNHNNNNNNHNSNNNIGSVSITPISKNPNQKATINPNIMKLVQNNPHLTIKTNVNQTPSPPLPQQQQQSTTTNLQNNYKCSNCWESFNNKSHLYFHKKNKCEGSRYPCPFCKKRFGTESAYSSHIFYSHPE